MTEDSNKNDKKGGDLCFHAASSLSHSFNSHSISRTNETNHTRHGACLQHYHYYHRQKKRNSGFNAKSNLFLLLKHYFSALFINFHLRRTQFFIYFFAILLFSQFLSIDAYIYTHEGDSQSHLYKRLAGRQRREAQREILTMLGLSHRPRPHNTRSLETSSAPLYMLGLYNTASHHRDLDLDGSIPTSTGPPGGDTGGQGLEWDHGNPSPNSQGLGGRSPLNRDDLDVQFGAAPDLDRYIEDSGILSNEIGLFVPNSEQVQNELPDGQMTSDSTEKRLLDQSDLVISFINTKQQQVLDDSVSSTSSEVRAILRRHRSYHFDTSQTSREDRLRRARFRLYKTISDPQLGNQTLRVSVYQTMIQNGGSVMVHLLGSRLVGSNQEGWLVYDVSTVLHDWILHPNTNLGLKVTVETMEGRYVKLTRTGLVGRRGSPSKQAFIVAFFTQVQQELLPLSARRFRRNINPASTPQSTTEASDGQWDTDENSTESIVNDVTVMDDDDEYDDDDDEVTMTNDDDDSRIMSKRKTKPKESKQRKKGRKRNRQKNTSKQKPVVAPCQRIPFNVDFKDLNWHTWIIAPKAYKAYQCLGKCTFPLNAALNATNHAIVQSLVHVHLQDLHIPEPCCAPSQLEPLEILFFNDQTKVIYKKYRDMVVSSCGCH